jgi:23S rRNA (adenine-N6)-dimethyltransferase
VVDIGAGSGMLTQALARAGARVIAIELDPELAGRLRRSCPRATIVESDARTVAWPREPFRVVANLPFAGATEICRSLLSSPRTPVVSVDVVLEWQVAVQWAGVWPSSVSSVLSGSSFEFRVGRRLAAAAFAPPPSVSAGVLHATRRARPLVSAEEIPAYEAFLRHSFSVGRVRRTSARTALARLAAELGLDRDPHARDLDARQWASLFMAEENGQRASASARTVSPVTKRRRGRAR